ncbi:hypothetical protein OKA05_08775 [Luteolibacter arcticus]|uniref:Uncharacterized protein n=1 Tax=Luteolibacter arcticus TaxID=1581411 RepID=A0ABT3GGA4_9BACT|nr:hypothetical protein [Luteolibacter arcticus]MCW1922646.1 hypothetical protein [Luteolibacter arcticus]
MTVTPRLGKNVSNAFALVATLTMMALLTLLVIGLASLSVISLRSGSRGEAAATARANARLAITLAIGDLQRHLGPDPRVCAPASIFDADPATAEIDGVRHPHWLGAWESARSTGKAWLVTPWSRDDADGGLRDARATGDWSRDKPLGWLVSGTHADQPVDPLDSSADEDWITLSAGGPDGSEVKVPTVRVESGRHAWWVSDESAKAKLDLADPLAGAAPSADDPASYRRWLLALSNQPGAVDAALEIGEKDKQRLSSLATLDLSSPATTAKAAARFHDFTVWSVGLPVNVRDGRLKRDLSVFLKSSGNLPDLKVAGKTLARGLADADRLVGPANQNAARDMGVSWTTTRHQRSSPTLRLLREWAALATKFEPGKVKGDVIPVGAAPSPLLSGDDSFDGTNRKPAGLAPYDSPDISPVLVEGSLYYNLASEPVSPGLPSTQYQLVAHLYPRAAIWNPYNVALRVPATTLMLQANGSKAVEITPEGGAKEKLNLTWGQGGALGGTLYFQMSAVTLDPGTCAVFSPTGRTPYSDTALGGNSLSASVAPSTARGFTVKIGTPRAKRPLEFREVPGGVQAEDYRMLWKLGSATSVAAFTGLPQLSFVSCALQYGDNKELPVSWNSSNPAPINDLRSGGSLPPPDTRTRDGFRLRWFEEHPSNLSGSGSLQGTRHFDIAPLANWNPRASYSLRSPYENLTDVAPHFFGAYTRDLFDQSVSWDDLMPVPDSGIQRGNPFGRPIESPGPQVIFEIPRKGVEMVSLAQFRHAKLSPFIWHPSFAIGNSLADPRLEDRTDRSAPPPRNSGEKEHNGWNEKLIGYANDGRTGGSEGNGQWAFYARWAVGGLPDTEALVHDLSFEVNHSLWDDFFLSTGSAAGWREALGAPDKGLMQNPRHRVLFPAASEKETLANLADFHRAAFHLGIDGGFNVNSTSVDAWTAVLAATRDDSGESTFPRLLDETAAPWKAGDPADSRGAWSGRRVLDDAEVRSLAEAVVAEVKTRGPFLSLSDFVNRRLAKGPSGRAGALEAAIQRAALNKDFDDTYPLATQKLKDYAHPDNIADATRIDPGLMPPSKAWGAPGYLTQADVLQPIGPILTARGDTFTIRAYGDAVDPDGKVLARAWCEAVVQRIPSPLNPDESGLNPANRATLGDFGRAFRTVSFRWLNAAELQPSS